MKQNYINIREKRIKYFIFKRQFLTTRSIARVENADNKILVNNVFFVGNLVHF